MQKNQKIDDKNEPSGSPEKNELQREGHEFKNASEKKVDTVFESKESSEKKESTEADTKKIRQEIESADMDDTLKASALTNAQKLTSLKEREKLKALLQIAANKGVVYAVRVAQKMNDPYVLDAFHDLLAKEGYYKDFLK